MVSRARTTRGLSKGLAPTFLLSAALSCNAEVTDPLSEFKASLAVYLIVSPTVSAGATSTPSGFYGVALEIRSPFRSEFATVQSFLATRTRDGRRYGTTVTPLSGDAGFSYRNVNFRAPGNLAIQPVSTASVLGMDSLLAGEEIEFVLRVGQNEVRGRTRVPSAPQVRIAGSGTARVVRWGRTDFAHGFVFASAPNAFWAGTTRDTLLPFPDYPSFVIPRGTRAIVSALDSNYFNFVVDTARTSAGLTGAFGLCGSLSVAEAVVP